MHIVLYNPNYQLGWIDDGKTILQIDIHPGWTWDDGRDVLEHINAQISSVEHDVYMIYNFTYRAKLLTRHFSTRNVKLFLEKNMPNERMAYIVGADSLLANLIGTLTSLYSHLSDMAHRVRFVESLEDAYADIHTLKAERLAL